MDKRHLLTGHQKDILDSIPDKFPKIPLEKVKKDIAETGQVPDKYRTRLEKRPDKIVKRPLEIGPNEAPRKYSTSIK